VIIPGHRYGYDLYCEVNLKILFCYVIDKTDFFDLTCHEEYKELVSFSKAKAKARYKFPMGFTNESDAKAAIPEVIKKLNELGLAYRTEWLRVSEYAYL